MTTMTVTCLMKFTYKDRALYFSPCYTLKTTLYFLFNAMITNLYVKCVVVNLIKSHECAVFVSFLLYMTHTYLEEKTKMDFHDVNLFC